MLFSGAEIDLFEITKQLTNIILDSVFQVLSCGLTETVGNGRSHNTQRSNQCTDEDEGL